MDKANVISINVSDGKGTIKKPIPSCTIIENFGLENDAHASSKTHRQVSLLAYESYQKGYQELPYGSFGENITTKGVILHLLPIGTILKIGECVMEVSQIGKVCHSGCDISKITGTCVMPKEGIFAKVITGGAIHTDAEIEIINKEV